MSPVELVEWDVMHLTVHFDEDVAIFKPVENSTVSTPVDARDESNFGPKAAVALKVLGRLYRTVDTRA